MLCRCLHKDPSYTKWAISYTAARYEHPPPLEKIHNTRLAAKEIPAFGGDFVDYLSHVIVRGARNTMMVFQPDHPHGTTVSYRVDQVSLALTSTMHLLLAYEKAKAAGGVERLPMVNVDGGDI